MKHKAAALEAEVRKRAELEKSLKSREAELSDFLENALEGVHRVAADGTILWANRAELAMLGYAPAEYIGRQIGEFHADRELAEEILERLLRGETLYDQPARMRCKDGSIKHVLFHSSALFENGQFVYSRCFTRDVTERVRLEAELKKRIEQLAEADARKNEFLAMLGHELRNPLAPIVNALELMKLAGKGC